MSSALQAKEQTHQWQDPKTTQFASRSTCPALNAMANHNYLPHDGRNITVWELIAALQACYKLSAPLAYFLGIGGFLLLRNFRFRPLNLDDIDSHAPGIHTRVEHDASLVHADTSEGDLYAPVRVIPELVEALVADANTERDRTSRSGRVLMSVEDVARSRVRVQKTSRVLNALQAEIARGEMALIMGMWNVTEVDNDGVPVEWVKDWVTNDRLPNWRAQKTITLWDTAKTARQIKLAMERLEKEEKQKREGTLRQTDSLTAGMTHVVRAVSTIGSSGVQPRPWTSRGSSAGSAPSFTSDSDNEHSETEF